MEPAERYARIKEIFLEAVGRPPSEVEAFVRSKSDGDDDLTREVLSLLSHRTDAPLIRERAAPPAANAPDLAPRVSMDPLGVVGALIDSRYHVERYVDQGGFSYVYRAEHTLWKKPVALKFFRAGGGGGGAKGPSRDAFVREGAILNDLARQSPSIVQSYDVGTWTNAGGESYLFTALEWLEGKTLAQQVAAERVSSGAWGWTLERVVTTLDPIANALSVAHGAGIAHRDVKPSNIFLVMESSRRTAAKLLDFGIAKTADASKGFDATASAGIACTVAYAAPEQLARSYGATGPWTDVYSLALVCVELMLGRHPVAAGASGELGTIIARTCDAAMRPTPAGVGLKVAPDIEAIFQKALAVDPQKRYPNAGLFWDAVRVAVGKERRIIEETSILHGPSQTTAVPLRADPLPAPVHVPRVQFVVRPGWAIIGIILASAIAYRIVHPDPGSKEAAPPPAGRAKPATEGIDAESSPSLGRSQPPSP